MDEGLDLRTWLTLIGVLVGFVGVPGLLLELERRRGHREEDRAE